MISPDDRRGGGKAKPGQLRKGQSLSLAHSEQDVDWRIVLPLLHGKHDRWHPVWGSAAKLGPGQVFQETADEINHVEEYAAGKRLGFPENYIGSFILTLNKCWMQRSPNTG